MFSESDINKIKEIILLNVPNIEEIILFGSYAKGTANQNSDLDFAVLTDSEIERSEKLQLLAKIRWDVAKLGYNIDILIKTKDIFLDEIDLPTLSKVIHTEGKYIWKKE